MKNKIVKTIIGVIMVMPLLMGGCEDRTYHEYYVMEPVYMSYAEMRLAVDVEAPQTLSQPGKIYIRENFIFINENFKGVHIIDNTDPSSPSVAGFINIPGNVDMAVVDNYLYADSYTDLVVLDISDLTDIREADRLEDIFPYAVPETGDVSMMVGMVDPAKGVVIGWEKEKRRERVGTSPYNSYRLESFGFQRLSYKADYHGGSSAGNSAGQAGSMARFGIFDNYLYAIDHLDLHVINIENFSSPVKSGSTSVAWNIETMFIYGDKMFIGGQNGMYIYDLADPQNPGFLSSYLHITACDPVVVEGKRAYVTLRAGAGCGGINNRLDVIDISDLSKPALVKFYDMKEPYGLGIDNNILFICEGNHGLHVYDATDPLLIAANKIASFPDIHAFDVIPVNGILLMIGLDGLYQYDYSDISDVKQLSFIPVYREEE
jgi:hypothetical protein